MPGRRPDPVKQEIVDVVYAALRDQYPPGADERPSVTTNTPSELMVRRRTEDQGPRYFTVRISEAI